MKLHSDTQDGPPCRHMEGFLQATADGKSRGFVRWYASSHAARCGRCGTYLHRMTETVAMLRLAKEAEPAPEAVVRLAASVQSRRPTNSDEA